MDYRYYAQQIKSTLSAADVFRFYGFEVNRAGFTCCPFHSEKTPSCKVDKGDKGFYCFGCNQGGSVIDFVMKYFDLSFKDAVKKINNDFGLNLPIDRKITLRQQRQMDQRVKQMKAESQIKKKLEDEYQKALTDYVNCDKIIREGPDENGEVTDEFLQALKEIEYVKYKLDEAEMRLYEYGIKRQNNNDANTASNNG